jgi:tryptophan synthase beta chain
MQQTFTNPNEHGYYGDFGGAFIPEMLFANVAQLKSRYLEIMDDQNFKEECNDLLKNYVGRPTPLFLAKRLTEQYGTTIYL